jgi:hypothetical protein
MSRDRRGSSWDYEMTDWGAHARARAVPVEYDYDGWEGFVWE